MTRMNNKVVLVKLIFSFLSLFLMIPLILKLDNQFYLTFFIFFVDKVIDVIFGKVKTGVLFFTIWSVFNIILGIVICAFALAFVNADFSLLFNRKLIYINWVMFAMSLSYLIKDLAYSIYLILNQNLLRERLGVISGVENGIL